MLARIASINGRHDENGCVAAAGPMLPPNFGDRQEKSVEGQAPADEVVDVAFQEELLARLQERTGIALP